MTGGGPGHAEADGAGDGRRNGSEVGIHGIATPGAQRCEKGAAPAFYIRKSANRVHLETRILCPILSKRMRGSDAVDEWVVNGRCE